MTLYFPILATRQVGSSLCIREWLHQQNAMFLLVHLGDVGFGDVRGCHEIRQPYAQQLQRESQGQ